MNTCEEKGVTLGLRGFLLGTHTLYGYGLIWGEFDFAVGGICCWVLC